MGLEQTGSETPTASQELLPGSRTLLPSENHRENNQDLLLLPSKLLWTPPMPDSHKDQRDQSQCNSDLNPFKKRNPSLCSQLFHQDLNKSELSQQHQPQHLNHKQPK